MKIVIAFLAGILLTGIPFSYLAFASNRRDPDVLAENVETSSPSPTEAPSPSPSPTPEPTVEPTEIPLPTPPPGRRPSGPEALPQPTFTSAEINSFIDRFAGQYAVDPNVLRHIAICESGFNPLARNAGYAGLYQFGPITWKNYRIAIGEDPNPNLRLNAEEAVQTAAYALSQGKSGIWPNCTP